jgi:apolipoprotein N-acyltransferase
MTTAAPRPPSRSPRRAPAAGPSSSVTASPASAPPGLAPAATRWRRPLSRRGQVVLAVAATSALTALAAPPVGLAPCAVLALAPLAWLLSTVTRWHRALLAGLATSALTTLLVFSWVPGALHAFFKLPLAACWALFPLYAAVAQPQLAVWALLRWRQRHRADTAALLGSAGLYAGLDWLLPKLFRDTLGVAFVAEPWVIQVVDLGGLYLLTFAAVFVAEVVAQVALHRRRALPAAITAAVLWAAILGYGALRSAQIGDAQRAAPTLSVGVVQANIGNIEKEIAARGDLDGIINTLKVYGELSDQLVSGPPPSRAALDLLVWPETAYPLAYGAHRSALDDDVDHELETYVRERKVPLLFGGYQRRGDTEFNSALLLRPDGAISAYHKFHLIPFGEYIPLLGRARFGVGGTPRVLSLATAARAVSLAPVICYESLIPSHAAAAARAGAQVLMNLTNDSWFLSDAEKELHLAMAAVRSVETRRAQLRATNTGITALILPTGEVRGRGPVDAPAALRFDVPIVETPPTLAVRFGTWSGPAGLLLWALALVLGGRRRRAMAGVAPVALP